MVYSEKQYKLLEQQLKKLKKENELKEKENKILKTENKLKDEAISDLDKYNYREKCGTLKLENKELKKKLENVKLELEKLKNSLNKNSSNSLKPSSTDGFNHVIQNNRIRTGKKPGRQKGYASPPPKYIDNPDEIIVVSNNNANLDTCSCGGHIINKDAVRRQTVGIRVIPIVKEYQGYLGQCNSCGKEYSPEFPTGVNNPINYDNSIKSLLVYLNTYNNVPERGITNFISFMTDNIIDISPATVINTVKEFSKKSKPILKDIKEEILISPVINSDETPIKVNGKEKSVLGVFTDEVTLLEAHENRKEEAFLAMNILNIYTGISVHDHNKMHAKFLLSTQSECNFHPIRYATEQIEIHGFTGITQWIEIILQAKEKTEKAKEANLNSLSEKEIEEIRDKYLRALDKWDEEHNGAVAGKNPEYYKESRRLKTRLREFVDDHLRFLGDFRIPFTNNLAERGLRPIKTKQKIGNFRSLAGAQNYCNARSIIDTSIKQKLNVGEIISKIFNNETNIFNFQNKNTKTQKVA